MIMLSRGAFLATSRRRFLTGSAVVSFVGGTVVYNKNSYFTNSNGFSSDGPRMKFLSLVIPTIEATVRGTRLIYTTLGMVKDYKAASFKNEYSSWFLYPSFLVGSNKSDNDEEKQRRHWEEELERRRKKLREVQNAYITATSPRKENLEAKSKQKSKKELKKEMLHAAKLITEAEDSLNQLGNRKRQTHRKAAKRMLKLCRDNGGAYIKIGQYIALLDYIVPQDYIQVLSSLFNEAPLTDYDSVCKVIKEDLGRHPDELFDDFDPVPIASASLAQVHVAHTKDTKQKVAVKVQHRGLRETCPGDLFALTCVVHVVEKIFVGFTWGWILDEIKPLLPRELDFVNEGKNAEKAAANIKETGLNCVVPKILWEKTSPRVLTMEFEEGFKATDVESIKKAGLNMGDVAKLISSVFNAQIFKSAFVHCDPHPANVLLREKNGKPQMVLIDHGLYREITDDFRIRYAHLWKAMMVADIKGIEDACRSLGVSDQKYRLFAGMLTNRPFDEMIARSKTGSLSTNISMESRIDRTVIKGYAERYLLDVFALLDTLPRQMILLLKMYDCLRHIDQTLGRPTNSLVIAGRYAARALYEHDMREKHMSFLKRFKAWVGYMSVVLRIQIHDVGLLWLQTVYQVKHRLSLK